MPKAFDNMVDAIKKTLRKDNPKMKEADVSSRAYAIATTQWKKSHGGKLPSEKLKDWRVLEFTVPITENFEDDDLFLIRGVAITETTTLNNVKYVAEELERAAPTFRGVPILLDHRNEVKNIVGRTTEKVFFNQTNKNIEFEGAIMDKDIKEMIKDGRIQNVSIGAKVDDLTEEDDGSMKAIGVRGLELSLVAVPGDHQANFAQALTHSFHLKEMMEVNDDLNNKEVNNMEIEKKVKEQDDAKAEETPEETKAPETEEKPAEEKSEDEKPAEEVKEEKMQNINIKVDDSAISEMRKEIEEMKQLLLEKKKLKEQVEDEKKEDEEKEDETKGEVSTDDKEEKAADENVVLERADSGKLAIYRDYSKESSDSKLKRLVR